MAAGSSSDIIKNCKFKKYALYTQRRGHIKERFSFIFV